MANTPSLAQQKINAEMLQITAAARALHDPSKKGAATLQMAYEAAHAGIIHHALEALENIRWQNEGLTPALNEMENDIKIIAQVTEEAITPAPTQTLRPPQSQSAEPGLSKGTPDSSKQ